MREESCCRESAASLAFGGLHSSAGDELEPSLLQHRGETAGHGAAWHAQSTSPQQPCAPFARAQTNQPGGWTQHQQPPRNYSGTRSDDSAQVSVTSRSKLSRDVASPEACESTVSDGPAPTLGTERPAAAGDDSLGSRSRRQHL
ncbi:hypothetical protein ON010_g14576 [Phytophthora cinnamomi]|nr:hypothetical protein ON010_g14576 [Phytophthora cinnamomi]